MLLQPMRQRYNEYSPPPIKIHRYLVKRHARFCCETRSGVESLKMASSGKTNDTKKLQVSTPSFTTHARDVTRMPQQWQHKLPIQ